MSVSRLTLTSAQRKALQAIARCEVPEVSTRTANALVEHGLAKISGGCLVPTEEGREALRRTPMNNDIAKDAARINGIVYEACNRFTKDHSLGGCIHWAITRATAADKERIASLEAWQKDVTEREGACCPEDVGFDEYISRLERKLAAKTQECEGLRDLNEQLCCEIQGLRDSARKEGK